ncbi:MAG: hypothetical protein AB9846_11200 [Tenuifilaceae bacterium]
MERAKVLNLIINQIKILREETTSLFSRELIVPNAEIMVEEYFEAKLNPFLEKVTSQVRNLPEDEYIIVALDTWIKDTQDQLKQIEESVIIDEFAEVLYIRQKFLPVLVDKLQDLKLEKLEREFKTYELEIKTNEKKSFLPDDLALNPDGIAVIVSLLYNHRIINPSISIDEICNNFSKLTGYKNDQIQSYIQRDSTNARLTSIASLDELERIAKIIKVMSVRVETSIAEKKKR